MIWSDKRAALFYGCSNWPDCDYTLPFHRSLISDEASAAAVEDSKNEAKAMLNVQLKLGRKAASHGS